MMKSGKSDSNNKLLNATAEGRKGTDVTVWPGPPLMPIFPRNPEVSVEVSDISAATDKFDYSVLDPEVADEARTIAGRIQGRMRESILETGRDLIAIKAKLDHGKFGLWVQAEFRWTIRTANNYMNASRLECKSETLSLLRPAALYALAAPSAPAAAVKEVLAAIQGGHSMDLRAIKAKLAGIDPADSNGPAPKGDARSKAGGTSNKEQKLPDDPGQESGLASLAQRIAVRIERRDVTALANLLTSRGQQELCTFGRILIAVLDEGDAE